MLRSQRNDVVWHNSLLPCPLMATIPLSPRQLLKPLCRKARTEGTGRDAAGSDKLGHLIDTSAPSIRGTINRAPDHQHTGALPRRP